MTFRGVIAGLDPALRAVSMDHPGQKSVTTCRTFQYIFRNTISAPTGSLHYSGLHANPVILRLGCPKSANLTHVFGGRAMRLFLGIVALIVCGSAMSAHATDSAGPAQGTPQTNKAPAPKQVKCILGSEIPPSPTAAASDRDKKTCSYSCAGMDTKPTEAVALKQTCPQTIMHTTAP
jgi:hypothetical protein